MCKSSKSCIIAWWVAVIISIILWYRNSKYDRIIASILFILGIIQLINYGCHSAVDPGIAGNITIIMLILVVLVSMLSIWIYTNNYIALLGSVFFSVSMLVVIYKILTRQSSYISFTQNIGSPPKWSQNSGHILGFLFWPFIIALLVSWIILSHHEKWNDIGLYMILIYSLCCILYIIVVDKNNFIQHLTYLLIGIGMITFVYGMFNI